MRGRGFANPLRVGRSAGDNPRRRRRQTPECRQRCLPRLGMRPLEASMLEIYPPEASMLEASPDETKAQQYIHASEDDQRGRDKKRWGIGQTQTTLSTHGATPAVDATHTHWTDDGGGRTEERTVAFTGWERPGAGRSSTRPLGEIMVGDDESPDTKTSTPCFPRRRGLRQGGLHGLGG